MIAQTTRRHRWRFCPACIATTCLLLISSGCLSDREFRAAALPAVQSGVSQILNGFLDGVFAAIAPEPESDQP